MEQRQGSNNLLELQHISQTYQAENGEVSALKDISFTVGQGEFICIVGPSGCGKSTLLSVIAGIEPPTHGTILMRGQPVEGIRPEIAYMLQRDNLLPWRTIRENVLLGLEIQKKLDEETAAYVSQLVDTYGLSGFQDKYPAQLSGGMRQRAALIRTLAIRPELLLLDEAFSALDYQTRLAVTEDVYHILKRENKTTIMVTHDIPEAISMADRVIVLSRRPAQVKAVHPIEFGPGRTPLSCRNQPQFSGYFDQIWRELDVHV